MKKQFYRIRSLAFSILILASVELSAQLQIDHQIQLTGAGNNARITGIQTVAATKDATSVDYIQRDSLKFALDQGSNNAYLVNLNPPVTNGYTVGMVVFFKASFTNTGAATLAVNALPQATIKKNYNVDLVANDIKAGQMVAVMYDGANFQMLSQLGNASAGNHGKQFFSCTGSDQYFYVPDGVTSLDVKLWGAGGGYAVAYTGNSGGGGAFVRGTLTVTPGQILKIIVGQGGGSMTTVYGGAGIGVGGQSGSGGGRSAIQIVNGTDVVTAGGGGGGGSSEVSLNWGNGGGGGAPNGTNGTNGAGNDCASEGGGGGAINSGGTAGASCTSPYNGTFPGNAGTQYKGANVNTGQGAYDGYGGGGGGGYFGGGSGASYYGGGGGGGSSYYTNSGFTLTTMEGGQTIAGGSTGIAAAGGTTDPDYPAGIGAGGESNYANNVNTVIALSGNGLVVITY